MTDKKKLLIVGLDGASFDIIDPLIEQGKLPTIKRLLDEGARGRLKSTIHPVTAIAWTSMMTGKNAGKHGVYDFRLRKPGTYTFSFINGGWRTAKSLWKILSEHDRSVGVVNVPFTYPPEPVNGFIIPGMDAPRLDRSNSYPEGIFEEVISNVDKYMFRGVFETTNIKKDFNYDLLNEIIENRVSVAKYLLSNKPWDFFMVVFNETDHVQHLFWQHMEMYKNGDRSADVLKFGKMIESAYEKIDQELGKLLLELPDDLYVMLVSDHGCKRLKKTVYLNRLLANNGLLKTKNRKELHVGVIRHMKFLMKKLLGASRRDQIRSLFRKFFDNVETISIYGGIDWQETKVYSFGLYGNIAINLKGREPQGIVEPEDYEKVCEQVRELLLDLKDPDTNENIVEYVHYGKDIFKGELSDLAPDLLVQWKSYNYIGSPLANIENVKEVDEVPVYMGATGFRQSGVHDLYGIFSLTGPNIKKGHHFDDAEIYDIAPTALYLLDLPVPSDMDGKVLLQIFNDDHVQNNEILIEKIDDNEQSAAANTMYDSDEEVEIKRRLSGLGYIE